MLEWRSGHEILRCSLIQKCCRTGEEGRTYSPILPFTKCFDARILISILLSLVVVEGPKQTKRLSLMQSVGGQATKGEERRQVGVQLSALNEGRGSAGCLAPVTDPCSSLSTE